MWLISASGRSTVTKGRELFARETTSLFHSYSSHTDSSIESGPDPFARHFYSQHCTHAAVDKTSPKITEGGFHNVMSTISMKDNKLKLLQCFPSLVCHFTSMGVELFFCFFAFLFFNCGAFASLVFMTHHHRKGGESKNLSAEQNVRGS